MSSSEWTSIFDGKSLDGWSTTGNLGQGVFGQGNINNASGLENEEYKSFSHTYASLGLAIIIKITNNFFVKTIFFSSGARVSLSFFFIISLMV